MATVNATTLAAAGSLVAIAELIELIKDPEYAKRIPELVDAHATILQAEDLRKEQAAFGATKAKLASDVAAAEKHAATLSALEQSLAQREASVARAESNAAASEQALKERLSEVAKEAARLAASIASYADKESQLDQELSEARTANAEVQAIKDEYKAKLKALSNI